MKPYNIGAKKSNAEGYSETALDYKVVDQRQYGSATSCAYTVIDGHQRLAAIEAKKWKNYPVISKIKIGRNDKCWCGSGLKFKRCHYN